MHIWKFESSELASYGIEEENDRVSNYMYYVHKMLSLQQVKKIQQLIRNGTFTNRSATKVDYQRLYIPLSWNCLSELNVSLRKAISGLPLISLKNIIFSPLPPFLIGYRKCLLVCFDDLLAYLLSFMVVARMKRNESNFLFLALGLGCNKELFIYEEVSIFRWSDWLCGQDGVMQVRSPPTFFDCILLRYSGKAARRFN